MKNVYDIKYEKNLNFILPQKERLKNADLHILKQKVAVIIHLYYIDTIEDYFKYIEAIPSDIDIFFTVSDYHVKELLVQAFGKKNNCKIIEKQNRGRDISSLLVACREHILKYEYVCFIHDKKERSYFYKKDTENWIQCLWENMLGGTEYIENIIATLYENLELGLLAPPSPLSEHCAIAYVNSWYDNFDRVKLLASEMNLNCNLDYAKPPITLGTAFWAKTSALEKLFEIEWKYEDFDEEPLKIDGTISHAIERIFAYVVQDAGFETGWVMTDKYAGERLEYMERSMRKAFERLNESLGVSYIAELDSYEKRLQEMLKFIHKYKQFYIYGAGTIGKSCFLMLKNEQKTPEAFLVSDIEGNAGEIQGIPVYSLEQIELHKDCGVIIGVAAKYQNDILVRIKERYPDFSNIYIYDRY